MKKIKVQKLTYEAFHKFGTYSMVIDPFPEEAAGPKDADCVFFRNLLQQDLGGNAASFSTCRVVPFSAKKRIVRKGLLLYFRRAVGRESCRLSICLGSRSQISPDR